jgi:DNA-binding transcriptional LysR family regulator
MTDQSLFHQLLSGGLGALFPNIEVRHLHGGPCRGRRVNLTRAAVRLRITQPALSKQITDLEGQYGYPLFIRIKNRIADLTDAGRVFVEEARSCLFHMERAIHLGRAAHEGCDSILMIGHSPYANHTWTAAMLATRLPLYPRLRILLRTQFAMESIRSVLVGEVNLALVTAPPQETQITAVPFASAPLYAALPESHTAARKENLFLRDLAEDHWILFAKRVHPIVFEAIMDTAQRESIIPKQAHDIFTPQQAVDLVSEQVGVAIFPKPTSPLSHASGVVLKPLCDASLRFDTCVIMRAADESKLVNEFVRSFLRKHVPQRMLPQQLKLSLSA